MLSSSTLLSSCNMAAANRLLLHLLKTMYPKLNYPNCSGGGCFASSDCITAAYISLEFNSTSRTTKSRLNLLCFVRSCSPTLLLERQEIFDGLFLGNPTSNDYATNVDQEDYVQNIYCEGLSSKYLLLFASLFSVTRTICPGMAWHRPVLHRRIDRVYSVMKPQPSVATKPQSIAQAEQLGHPLQ